MHIYMYVYTCNMQQYDIVICESQIHIFKMSFIVFGQSTKHINNGPYLHLIHVKLSFSS